MAALRALAPTLTLALAIVIAGLAGHFGGPWWGMGGAGLAVAGLFAGLRFTTPAMFRAATMSARATPEDPLPLPRGGPWPWPALLSGIPDPALMLDSRGIVLGANTAAASFFPNGTGRHISLSNRSPELLAAVEQALVRGSAQLFQVRSVVPVERTLAGQATPLFGQQKVAPAEPALLLVIRDHTAEHQLAEMRADFVANASHELRTPLSSLRGFVETLQGAAKDDPVARDKFLGIMALQATRMSRLIDDLLSLSRIEMREHVPPTERVDLGPVVADVVAALRPLAETATITIDVVQGATPLSDHAAVIGDRDELAQVAQNLIQNAIKYGRPGGRIDVAVSQTADQVVLSVKDYGIGIAPEHLPRLTERFYRVVPKDSRERGGTGLGLAIVKHIVNRHHGVLDIASKAGEGSVFSVRLPVA